jgi:hypothetical protein
MNDSEFRRRAHALLDDEEAGVVVTTQDWTKRIDERRALLAAGAASSATGCGVCDGHGALRLHADPKEVTPCPRCSPTKRRCVAGLFRGIGVTTLQCVLDADHGGLQGLASHRFDSKNPAGEFVGPPPLLGPVPTPTEEDTMDGPKS